MTDIETPAVITVPGAYDLVYDDGPDADPARKVLRDLATTAGRQYAAHLATAAADLLRRAFGPTAHRAVFDLPDCPDGDRHCQHADLLVVYDTDGDVLWYDGDDHQLSLSPLITEGEDDPLLPTLDDDTKQAIENLIGGAEATHADEYLRRCKMVIDLKADGEAVHYDGDLHDLIIGEQRDRLRYAVGEPAADGSAHPQRRLLTAGERAVAVRVLHDLLAPDVLLPPDVRMFSGDTEILADVARVLDPRERVDPPVDHQPGFISLTALERLLYRETAVIAEENVPLLMDAIRTAARLSR